MQMEYFICKSFVGLRVLLISHEKQIPTFFFTYLKYNLNKMTIEIGSNISFFSWWIFHNGKQERNDI